ncbi:MAG: hypothetical protein V1794_03325 [Candidatus Glassbacteria bacterium]
MLRNAWVAVSLFLLMSFGRAAAADIDFSFLTTLGYTGLDRSSQINTMFRGDDPFNPVRVTAFAESWISPKIGVFLEFLWDQGAQHSGGDTKPRVNGAYAVARPWNTDKILFKIGLVPSPFGAWAPRTYADRNPLVGLPLMYHYRTPIEYDELPEDEDELFSYRAERGLPIAYDACWNQGVIAFGFAGKWEYSFGVTKEAISSPRSYGNNGANFIGHLGCRPIVGLRLGTSLAYGSYLGEGTANLPAGMNEREPKQIAFAADFSYEYAYTSIFAEAVRNKWEVPTLAEDLGCSAWYLELKQKLSAGFYLAGRIDRLTYNEHTDSAGERFTWGYDLWRYETGFGYTFTRGVTVKTVWQHNNFDDDLKDDVDLLCTQLVLTF